MRREPGQGDVELLALLQRESGLVQPIPRSQPRSSSHHRIGSGNGCLLYTSSPIAGDTLAGTYRLSDVAKHANAASCWTAVDGNVYNLTDWVSRHPGGQRAILGLCGRDGSSAFDAEHGGQRRPSAELKKFLIGTLR